MRALAKHSECNIEKVERGQIWICWCKLMEFLSRKYWRYSVIAYFMYLCSSVHVMLRSVSYCIVFYCRYVVQAPLLLNTAPYTTICRRVREISPLNLFNWHTKDKWIRFWIKLRWISALARSPYHSGTCNADLDFDLMLFHVRKLWRERAQHSSSYGSMSCWSLGGEGGKTS